MSVPSPRLPGASQRALPRRRHLSAAVGLCLLAAGAAPAEEAGQNVAKPDDVAELPSVAVTAERRETALQKTPISVGVISAGDLDRIGFNKLFDIEKSVAGVSFFKGASNQQSSVIIRGVGTTNQGYTQAVGIYIDDVPLVRSVAAGQWDLPDVEQIEVLRGPQGTLYGQNSSAGAVRINSRDPDDEKVGWISLGLGNYSALETRGYFAGPLKEGVLAGSLAFSHTRHDGYGTDHSTGDDVYGADTTAARGKLRLTPNDSLDVVLAVDALLDKSDNGTNATPLNYGDTKPRDTWALQDFDESKLKRAGASLRVTQKLNDWLDLRSISAYRGYEHNPDPMDIGGLPRISNTFDQTIRQRVFSQELQLLGNSDGVLSPTAGVLYIHENWINNNTQQTGSETSVTRRLTHTHYSSDDIALYAQVDWRFAERWNLTAGARYWHTEQSYDAAATSLDADLQPIALTFAVDGLKKTSSGITPRLTLGWQWTPQTYLYASYTEGAKFGGYNRSAATEEVARVAADPEEVTAYELGLKTSAFANRLQVNFATYYNDYEDYLATVTSPTLNGVLYNGAVLVNAAKAVTYGAEFEVRARLARSWDWNLSLAYNTSEFKEFLNPSGSAASDYSGNELTYAPRRTASTGLSWSDTLASGGWLSLYGSLQYGSQQYTDAANTPIARIPSHTNVDVGGQYRFADSTWSLALRVRNLLDRDQIVQKSYIAPYGIFSAGYNVPRTFVASVRYDF